MPQHDRIAIALRSSTVPPKTIVKLASVVEGAPNVSHLFLPEGSQGSFSAIELGSACLGASNRLRVGSGVIRILEHDPNVLAQRLLTLQALSNNRFVLGIGTGRPTINPKETIQSMLERLHMTRRAFEKFRQGSPGVVMPEIFTAALRRRITQFVAGDSDGILLNFCTPHHAEVIVKSFDKGSKRPTLSCYLKIFYSKDDSVAKRMLIEEFGRYDQIPSYHAMFRSIGVARAIAGANSALGSGEDPQVTEELSKISLANPTKKQLVGYVASFRGAGVDLPCVYPYFETGADEDFIASKVTEIARL